MRKYYRFKENLSHLGGHIIFQRVQQHRILKLINIFGKYSVKMKCDIKFSSHVIHAIDTGTMRGRCSGTFFCKNTYPSEKDYSRA